jgi:MoaA/NifB/PqqE/SkfB family radical SAM enzyme
MLNLTQWKDILQEAKQIGFDNLHIFGGEPFLAPNIKEFCILAIEMEYRILIATNGITFRDSDFDWLEKNEINLSFTINEIDQSWNELSPIKKKNIERIQKHRINYSIATCLNKKNYSFYENFITEMQRYGLENFFGIYFSPIGRASDKKEEIIEPTDWIQFVEKMNSQYGVRIEQSFIGRDTMALYPWVSEKCPMYTGDMMTISNNGEIFPCFLLMNSEKRILQWTRKGDFKTAFSIINQLKQQKIESCPAYFDDNGIDFRKKSIKSEDRAKLFPICPLISF